MYDADKKLSNCNEHDRMVIFYGRIAATITDVRLKRLFEQNLPMIPTDSFLDR